MTFGMCRSGEVHWWKVLGIGDNITEKQLLQIPDFCKEDILVGDLFRMIFFVFGEFI